MADKENKAAQKATKKAMKQAEREVKKQDRDESMPGYTKAQKTNRRVLIFVLIFVFVILIFVPIYGVARRNAQQRKTSTTAVQSTVKDPQKKQKINNMKLATERYATVIWSGKDEDFNFETLDSKSNTIMGTTQIKLKGYDGYFDLTTIYTADGDDITSDYIFLKGELDGRPVEQLVLNNGKFNSQIQAHKLPVAGKYMKTS